MVAPTLNSHDYFPSRVQPRPRPRPLSSRTLDPTAQPSSPAPLLQFPDEVLEIIVGYLSLPDLSLLALVNSDCRLLARPFQFCDLQVATGSQRLLQLLDERPGAACRLPIAPFVRSLRLVHGGGQKPRREETDADHQARTSVWFSGLLAKLDNLVALAYENHSSEAVLLDHDTLSALSSAGIKHLQLSNITFSLSNDPKSIAATLKAMTIDWHLESLTLDKVNVHAAYLLAKRSSKTLRYFTLTNNIQSDEFHNDAHACIFTRSGRFPLLRSFRVSGGPSLPTSYLRSLQSESPHLESIEYVGRTDNAFMLRETIPSLQSCAFGLRNVDLHPRLRSVFITANPQLVSLDITISLEIACFLVDPARKAECMQKWIAFVRNVASSLVGLRGLSLTSPRQESGAVFSKEVIEVIAGMTSLRQLRLDGMGIESASGADVRATFAELMKLGCVVSVDGEAVDAPIAAAEVV